MDLEKIKLYKIKSEYNDFDQILVAGTYVNKSITDCNEGTDVEIKVNYKIRGNIKKKQDDIPL